MATPVTKHSINLREGDYEALQRFFGPRDIPASQVIRKLVSRFVDNLEAGTPPQELLRVQIPGWDND